MQIVWTATIEKNGRCYFLSTSPADHIFHSSMQVIDDGGLAFYQRPTATVPSWVYSRCVMTDKAF